MGSAQKLTISYHLTEQSQWLEILIYTTPKLPTFYTNGADVLSAANVRYVNTSSAALTVTLTDPIDKWINESHISSSTNKDVFTCYIMEEVDESSNENNIIVDGIKDFPDSKKRELSTSEWERGQKTGNRPGWQVHFDDWIQENHCHSGLPQGRAFLREKKDFLDRLNDFISDHCMEMPWKLKVKYSKRLTKE